MEKVLKVQALACRFCPQCGNLIAYKSKYSYEDAELANSKCLSCCNVGGENLAGRRFGKLVVKASAGRCRWNCLCDCGKMKPVNSNNLRNGTTVSCGCAKKHPNPWRRRRPYEYIYNFLAKNADRGGQSVSLTYEEFLEFVGEGIGHCYYCEAEITWSEYDGSSPAYHLDRKDNAQGYHKDNLVVCCPVCNRVKSRFFTSDEFLVMMRALKEYRAARNIQPFP